MIVEAASIDSPMLQAFPFHLNILICKSHLQMCLWEINCLYARGVHIFQKSGKHLKIPGARQVTPSKFHTEDPHTLGASVQKPVTMATWRPGFVHTFFVPSYENCGSHSSTITLTPTFLNHSLTYPRNRIFLMGCYSNNCALRKKGLLSLQRIFFAQMWKFTCL